MTPKYLSVSILCNYSAYAIIVMILTGSTEQMTRLITNKQANKQIEKKENIK